MITRLVTSFWAGAGQRLDRSLEVPGLGRSGQILEFLGWRFWGDLVRCWPKQVLGRSLADAGQILRRCWADVEQMLGRS